MPHVLGKAGCSMRRQLRPRPLETQPRRASRPTRLFVFSRRDGGMISVEQVTKRFGDLIAVDPLNFDIASGEVVGFLGPNGAGKTTTMRVLTGTLQPDNGRAPLRTAGDVVHEVRGGLREARALTLGDWRDKSIVRVDTAAVRAVLLEHDGKSARIGRADKGWKAAGGAGVDSARLADLLSELARFDATGFAADTA